MDYAESRQMTNEKERFFCTARQRSLSGKAGVSYRNAYNTDKKAFEGEKKESKTVVRKEELFTFANDYNIR